MKSLHNTALRQKHIFSIFFSFFIILSTDLHAADSCVILQYHHFSSTTPRSTSLTPEEFDAHIDYLVQQDFSVLPLQKVVSSLQKKTPLPKKCVAITVDDAYDSIYEVAAPRLKKLGWPMTVFVNTESIEDGVGIYMTWDQMRILAKQGVTFENHTHTHTHLLRKNKGESHHEWRKRIRADILQAQSLIQKELSYTPVLFAYPYGEYNPEIKQIVAEIGLAAFGQQSGPVGHYSDMQALPRFPMAAQYAAMKGFKVKVYTLPLPVLNAAPENPLLDINEWRPVLTLDLAEGDYQAKNLRCYISGQSTGHIEWLDKQYTKLKITPEKDLYVGRNRYNCTAPSNSGKRYYWYSHNFIRVHKDGRWYKE